MSDMERLKYIENGQKETQTFSAAEMDRRVSGLRQIMADKGLDAVVFSSYHNIKYYSDFLYTYFGRSYALVVTTHDLVTVSANIDGGMPWRRTWGNNVVYTDWRRDNYYHAISEILRSQSVTPRRIGIEADFMSLATREQFVSTFPDAELVDVSQATMRQRMLKSDEEINVIKHGARIADLGGHAIAAAIGD